MKDIKVQELTAESFNPFGHLIMIPERNPDITRESLDWWGNLYDLP